MSDLKQVGMAELKVVRSPDKLITAGLGSCIGICLIDKTAQVGGMAHIMLPSSLQARNAQNRAKFADTAVEDLISEMEKMGAVSRRIVAKIAGGSQMFKVSAVSEVLKIGIRNSQAVEEALAQSRIRLLAKDTGGNFGRTIIFDTESGDLQVRTIGHGEKII